MGKQNKMLNRHSEVHLDQLIKQILFLILQLVCHTIFGLLAWLPVSLFEGSALRPWTHQTSHRCPRAPRYPRWARTTCLTPAGPRTPRGMNSMRRCWQQARVNMGPQVAHPPAPTSPHQGAVRGQHPTCSPSPVAAPPRPTTPPSLRERLHHLILQHQQPRNLAAGRGNTPPPPYSNLQDSAPSSLTREALPQTSRPIRPTRARRRAQGPGSPAGAAPRRMSRTPSSPPPLVSRRSEGVGSTSDQSS